jgi:hypothetical protein
MKKQTILSVAFAGGQGKTTVAQLLHVAATRHLQTFELVAADSVDEAGRSKLGRLYPDRVIETGTGASLTAARAENNLNAPVRYWDHYGHMFLGGGHIMDVGANVLPALMQWAEDRRLAFLMDRASAPMTDILVVCRPEAHAVDDALRIVETLTKTRPFGNGRIFVVENEAGGPFGEIDMRRLLAQRVPGESVGVMRMTRCQSEIWPAMEARGMSIESALELSLNDLMERLGVDLWTAAAGAAELGNWVEASVAAINELDLFRTDDLSSGLRTRRAAI